MKKVLSIVLSIAMVVCLAPTMAFAATTSAQSDAAYSDITGKPCEGAVNVLTALGVVDGFTDGTFKPEQTVTRAQMAKLVVTALGVADYATATTSKYTDMGNATWAIPYVEYASNLNIVNGVGNGKFNPNGTVTYEQAVTMIVRALGYTDQCKEMNGTWPAIYVQKAMALGIFEDVVNGGANGANRGDTAIMLFNAIDLPEVYADGDGATQYKSGSQTFTKADNTPFKGTSMLATLNKGGEANYGILSESQADNAVVNVRDYVGAVGKIYTNKDGDVLTIGDLKTTFLTGTVNSKGDEFTTIDGTKYTVNSDSFSEIGTDGTVSKGKNGISQFVNGEEVTPSLSKGSNGALDDVAQNKQITIAAKVSGKTITNIYSESEWTKAEAKDKAGCVKKLFEESDATQIANKQKFEGFEFKTDDNGKVDNTSFILTGIDSLDKIAEDNVVYAYHDSKNVIRKVEVGTKTVEGTFESFSKGTQPTKANETVTNVGTQATFTIAGTAYKGTNCNVSNDDITNDNYSAWTLGDSDSIKIGDSVKAYLDASGKIYKIEQTAASSSDYALVLDYELYVGEGKTQKVAGTAISEDANTTVYDQGSLNGNNSVIKVMNAKGEVLTLTMKDEAKINLIKDDNGRVTGTFGVGDIITYDLNSSNKVKSVTVKAAYDSSKDGKNDVHDVTSKGYWNGTAINESAVIFSLDRKYNGTAKIDSDHVEISTYSSIKGSDDVAVYANVLKNSKYAAMVVGNVTSSDMTYGIVTNITRVDKDTYNADYKVTMLVNGESKDYYVDEDCTAPKADTLYAFKLNASGQIKELNVAVDGIFTGDTKKTILGTLTATDNGIKVKNNVATSEAVADKDKSFALDSSVKYYKYSSSKSAYEVADKSDLTGADANKVIVFLDTDKDDDKDKVADIVVIADNASTITGTTSGK